MTNEEKWFGYFLEELLNAGYIEAYEYQPRPFELCPESTHPFKKFQRKVYTADYWIHWSYKSMEVFASCHNKGIPFCCDYFQKSYIDVKGSGFKFGLNNSDVTFPDRQAWIWHQLGIFVQKVEVSLKKKSIFEKTFLPQRIKDEEIYTTTGKTWVKGDSKIKFNAINLEQYVTRQKEAIKRGYIKSSRMSGRTKGSKGEG